MPIEEDWNLLENILNGEKNSENEKKTKLEKVEKELAGELADLGIDRLDYYISTNNVVFPSRRLYVELPDLIEKYEKLGTEKEKQAAQEAKEYFKWMQMIGGEPDVYVQMMGGIEPELEIWVSNDVPYVEESDLFDLEEGMSRLEKMARTPATQARLKKFKLERMFKRKPYPSEINSLMDEMIEEQKTLLKPIEEILEERIQKYVKLFKERI